MFSQAVANLRTFERILESITNTRPVVLFVICFRILSNSHLGSHKPMQTRLLCFICWLILIGSFFLSELLIGRQVTLQEQRVRRKVEERERQLNEERLTLPELVDLVVEEEEWWTTALTEGRLTLKTRIAPLQWTSLPVENCAAGLLSTSFPVTDLLLQTPCFCLHLCNILSYRT